MICKNCGRQIADNSTNCPFCGFMFQSNIDYQQEYYRRKVQLQDEFHRHQDNFYNSMHNAGNDVRNAYNSAVNGVNSAVNNVQQGINNYKEKSEIEKNGNNAYIMGIVGLIVGTLVSRIAGIVLGILAMNWGKEAYEQLHNDKFKTAETLGKASLIVASVEIGLALISAIIYYVFFVLAATSYI